VLLLQVQQGQHFVEAFSLAGIPLQPVTCILQHEGKFCRQRSSVNCQQKGHLAVAWNGFSLSCHFSVGSFPSGETSQANLDRHIFSSHIKCTLFVKIFYLTVALN
jgi:hypothetical protein